MTFEEYLKSIKGSIYAVEGEIITCENGHEIMTCANTLFVNEMIIPLDFRNKTGQFMLAGRSPKECGICNRPYVRARDIRSHHYGNIQFFINGEYREKKYNDA